MAIGYRGAGNFNGRASPSAASATVTVPAGTASGDLLFLLASTFVSSGGPVAITTPSGWTLIDAKTWQSSKERTAIYYKVAGASEPSAVVAIGSAAYLDAQMFGFTGADATTPIDQTATWGAESSGTTVTVPAITTLTGNAWWVTFSVDSGTEFNATSFPAGWTHRYFTTPGSVNVAQHLVNTLLVVTAGAQSATSFTKTGTVTPQITIGLALRLSGASPVTAPVADFTGTPLTGTRPLSVAFTDTSTNTPTSWAWTFGDGGTSTSQNPTHSYTAAGTYTVTLQATNAGGSDTKTRTGYVTVANPSGGMTKIKWGTGLVVTDEGSGVIRVDVVP